MANTFKNVHHVSSFFRTPATQEQLVQALAFKAEKFVTAALMDIGAPVDVAESRALQLAVLQDFIEVHNEALHLAPVGRQRTRRRLAVCRTQTLGPVRHACLADVK